MKNHELLELIGDVNEDYVQEAGNNVVKPRFGWRKLAACAACAALVLAAYPVYRAANPPLHGYTVMEGNSMAGLQNLTTAKGEGIDTPELSPAPAQTGDDQPGDVPDQSKAIAQYQGLLEGMGGQGGYEPEPYPDWYGGAWIDNSYDPEAKLAVAVVDGFHTPELEAQVEEWCGGGVVFVQDMKYSYAHLLNLMDQILQAVKESPAQDDVWSAFTSMGPDIKANCLSIGFSGTPSDAALMVLAKLDPDGDAIRVEAFTDKLDTLTDEVVKGPAPGGVAQPANDPAEDAEGEPPQTAADPNTMGELPQDKYDAFLEGE